MRKSDINKMLKEFGYGYVKVTTNDWDRPEKCYTDFNGKRVKGIVATHRGPLDVTDAADRRIEAVKSDITDTFRDAGFTVRNGIFEAPDGTLNFTLMEMTYPQYTRSANMDDGYTQVVLVPNYL